jgi:hypothetical protein
MNTQIEIGILPFSLNKSMNYNKPSYIKGFKFYHLSSRKLIFS